MTDFLHPSETQQTQPGNVVVNVGLDLWKSWANGSGVPNAIIGVVSIGGMPGTPITVVTIGRFPLTVFNLGAGLATTVVAGNIPSRNVSGGLVIGTCDASGEIFLSGSNTSSSTGFFSPGADIAGGGTSNQAKQYVSSLSSNATGFLHGAAPTISVNGTGAGLNWVDDKIVLQQGGTTLVSLKAANSDFIALGPVPAATGLIRIPTGSYIASRNFANTSDVSLISSGTNDNVVIGGFASVGVTLLGSGGTYFQAAAISTDFAAFGTTPGSSGFIRATANATIVGVNGNAVLSTDGSTNTVLNALTGQSVELAIAGTVQVQVSSSSIFVLPPTIQWSQSAVLPTLTQSTNGAANGFGQALVVQAQNATGTTSTGGNLALSSGTGTSVAGALNLQVGAVTQIAVNGAATTITMTPATLQWAIATSSPTITQLSVSNQTQGQNLLIQPQQSTQATNFGSGSVLVNFQVPGGSGARALFQIQEGGTGFVWAGHATNVAQGCLWLGNGITPAVGNFALRSDGTAFTVLNVATGGTINFSVNSGAQATLSTTAFNIFAGATIIQPWTGTANTQTETVVYQPAVVRTTSTGTTTLYSFSLAAHKGAVIEVLLVARVVAPGTGWSPTDLCQGAHYRATVFWSGSGNATIQSSSNIWADTSAQASALLSFTGGANGLITISVTPSDSTSPTIDWEAMIMIVNN